MDIKKGCLVVLGGAFKELFGKENCYEVHSVRENDIIIKIELDEAQELISERYFNKSEFVKLRDEEDMFLLEVSKKDIVKIHGKEDKNNEEKVENKMNNKFGEIFNFGQYEGADLAITMEGSIAVKREDGNFVTYDSKNDIFENKMDFVVEEFSEMIMLMPSTEIKNGDIITKGKKFYQSIATEQNPNLFINLIDGSKVELVKEKNLFGMEMYTKVTNIMKDGLSFGQNTKEDEKKNDNGTNQMMQTMMMMKMLGKGSESEKGFDAKTMMMMSMMSNQGNTDNGFNPMMFMLMK